MKQIAPNSSLRHCLLGDIVKQGTAQSVVTPTSMYMRKDVEGAVRAFCVFRFKVFSLGIVNFEGYKHSGFALQN
jgi:hypothetical protein